MFSGHKRELYLHDAVTSVPNSLSRVSGNIVYLSLTNPSKPDCYNIQCKTATWKSPILVCENQRIK